jgi:Na+/phosphate symporter
LKKLEEESIETGPFYVQILDYLREIAHCLKYIADPVYEELDNNHPPLIPEQVKDLHELNESVSAFYLDVQNITRKKNFGDIDILISQQQSILNLIAKIKKKQIRFIKADQVGTRNTLMYLNLLAESKNLVLYTINMVKSHRDFILSDTGSKK